MKSKGKIGITSTVPCEVVYGAGYVPVDLNNLFISSDDPFRLAESAESNGIPRNYCAWIKGIYSIVHKMDGLSAVIGMTQGDCANNYALIENFIYEGVPVITFSYPLNRDVEDLNREIRRFCSRLDTDIEKAEDMRLQFKTIRAKLTELDRLTWQEDKATGYENHQWLVASSDLNGEPEKFETMLSDMLDRIGSRTASRPEIRLAYMGVPPIFSDIYDFLEEQGARVVYNEVQHQFSMPYETDGLVAQYLEYTYPYGILTRLKRIREEVGKRRVDGIVHYVQSFCFHQLEDPVVRGALDLPVLRIEGDKPGRLDSRTKVRMEAFLETLRDKGKRGV